MPWEGSHVFGRHSKYSYLLFFFFQAEDGIRDHCVTGVQTCALPISREAVTPIQLGENWSGLLEMKQSVAAGASDFAMLDAMKIGGVTGWLRAAALAQDRKSVV